MNCFEWSRCLMDVAERWTFLTQFSPFQAITISCLYISNFSIFWSLLHANSLFLFENTSLFFQVTIVIVVGIICPIIFYQDIFLHWIKLNIPFIVIFSYILYDWCYPLTSLGQMAFGMDIINWTVSFLLEVSENSMTR